MCGITAIVSDHQADHARLGEMTELLRHRGPDSGGLRPSARVSLGHRRLAILDLSEAAGQPMSNENGSIHLVCNGEIYNYKEKTAELKAKGHVFRSDSDCEVLLHLYEEHGDAFLEQVNGMFAFVLSDERRGRVLAAVDRFGKKPLYYAVSGDQLILASEMKSLLIFPWIGRDIDPLAVDRYLCLRYVPAPMTILKSVRKLEPATMLTCAEGRCSVRTYWKPRHRPSAGFDDSSVDAFESLLKDAVKLRLQSDVPLGLYLSGGIDSSAVAGMMRSLTQGRLVSFTLSVDYEHNERRRAQAVAKHLDIEFNPVSVAPEDFGLLPAITYHLDEPFGDLISMPAFLLAKKTKEKLTVALTGDGADEVLGGYFHQRVMCGWDRWKPWLRLPGSGRALSRLLDCVPTAVLNRFFDYPAELGEREKGKLSLALGRCGGFGSFYEGLTSTFSQPERDALYAPSWRSQASADPLAQAIDRDMASFSDFPYLSRLGLLDLKYWIPYSVVFRLDKLNMAHAVETRSPFLDYRVVEMALNLPREGKVAKGRNKEILRRVIERMFPPQFREKGKQAFYMPVPPRYRRPFFDWASSLLSKESVERRGLFLWPRVESLLQAFASEESMLLNRQLTALAMLELWFQTFVDREAPAGGAVEAGGRASPAPSGKGWAAGGAA
ncbi:MAG: asparagine synthase (glutamine-hydrolyzing) [Elusimicrobia bacterium]|nr:asparagine synthase (glutamine-hydrolyzing) [Elusimicrobiota bacterium]